MVRLAHSYPNGAPLVAITGQVGTDRLHIPVVNTMMAKGIIPMDDKYSLWIIGIPQKDYVNQLFDRADLVIAIGYDIVECAPAKWVARPDMTIPLFLFHLSLKAALPCRVTKKDTLRSLAKRLCLLMLKVQRFLLFLSIRKSQQLFTSVFSCFVKLYKVLS